MKRSLYCGLSAWVSGVDSMSNSTMSFVVTIPGGRWRDIRNLPGSLGCRTLIWPKASTTLSLKRILFAITRSSSRSLGGAAVLAVVLAAVFLAAAFIGQSLSCRLSRGKRSTGSARAQALNLHLRQERHQRVRPHLHDRRHVHLDQRLALVGRQAELVRIG